MIDFRYHLVSLISVFLALAVGIILGAGPLKEAIGDQLTGQVTSLRTEKEALRAELDDANATQEGSDTLLAAAAPKALAGALPSRRVSVVLVGDVDSDVVDSTSQYLAAAGATVVSTVQLSDDWFSQAKADSRQSYASSLAAYLAAGSTTDGYDTTLAHALVLAFSGYSSVEADTFAAGADLTREILVDSGLITIPEEPTAPADAYVVIEAGAAQTASTPAPTASAADSSLGATFATVLAADAEGAVVTATGSPAGTIVEAVTKDDTASSTVTTVAGVDSVVGQFMLPLALSERIGGTVAQYADTTAASQVPVAATLGAPDRAALVALGAPASSGDSTTGDTTTGGSTTEGKSDGSTTGDGSADGSSDADGADGK